MAVNLLDIGQWRFAVTTLAGEIATILDPFATNRTVTKVLGGPMVTGGVIQSDNREVYDMLASGPLVTSSSRLLVGMRREPITATTFHWVPRASGVLMQLGDLTGTEVAQSTFTAYDPWQYLMSLPILDADLSLPDQNGVTFDNVTGDQIALDLLQRAIDATFGGPVDNAFIDHGQTAFSVGPLETTLPATITFQPGDSVGSAWKQLLTAASMDIVLTPIYDPVNRPGLLSDMAIYNTAGLVQNGTPFSWDRPPYSLVGVDRMIDGNSLANHVQWYAGQGSTPVAAQSDAASIAAFGEYWSQQFQTPTLSKAAVLSMAQTHLQAFKDGLITIAVDPSPDGHNAPFVHFDIGDFVPLWSSSRFREAMQPGPVVGGAWSSTGRVYGIPIEIDDNGIETCRRVLMTQDPTV